MFFRTEKKVFQGEAGPIDCLVDLPGEAPRGWALVLHPHSLQGGTRQNKVVTTVARTCVQNGLMAVRPDFRGVGDSAGEFDHAVGETADMSALVRQVAQTWPEAAAGHFVLAGFSFGSAVAAQLYSVLADEGERVPDHLILLGCAVERFRFREVRVPASTLLVHGETDEIVPLSEGMDFGRAHGLAVMVAPDTGHFFHGRLVLLKQVLQNHLQGL